MKDRGSQKRIKENVLKRKNRAGKRRKEEKLSGQGSEAKKR